MSAVVNPVEPYASDPVQLMALCIWREARGEPRLAKEGVGWVILNRCRMAPAQGFAHSVVGNVLKPWAFSSFMQGDPNSTKYPEPTDPSWIDSLGAAEALGLVDPTNGAVFYFSKPITVPPSEWGAVVHSATIGGLQFYKI